MILVIGFLNLDLRCCEDLYTSKQIPLMIIVFNMIESINTFLTSPTIEPVRKLYHLPFNDPIILIVCIDSLLCHTSMHSSIYRSDSLYSFVTCYTEYTFYQYRRRSNKVTR